MSLRDRARTDASWILRREGDPVRLLPAGGSVASATILGIIGQPTQTALIADGEQRAQDEIEIIVGEAQAQAALTALQQPRLPQRGDAIVIESATDSAQGTWRIDTRASDQAGLLTLRCLRQRSRSLGHARPEGA